MKSINKDQIIKGIERANPWWRGEPLGDFANLPKRMHFESVLNLTQQLDPHRALVVLGPRRVGKTVLIYQIIHTLIEGGRDPKKILYLSLDNPIFRLNSLHELMSYGLDWIGSGIQDAIIFFDEIQYLETWEQQLKVLVDENKSTKFVVTGSAAAALHKKSKESGAGRFTNYLLPALSFYEYIQIKCELEQTPRGIIDLLKLNSLYLEYLNYGGFPESIRSVTIRNQPEQYIGQDILDKVLGRDLPSIYGINNPNELQKLFTALAYNTSNEISPENVSKESGVSKIDVHKYISFFEAALLMRVIEKTDDSLKKFKRKTHFKIILTNPSLRSAIFGKIGPDDRDLESLAETAIFSQLIFRAETYSPYRYARWNSGGSKGEVDLVHVNKKNEILSALEIKWSDRFATGDEKPRSLINFCKDHNLQIAMMTSKSIFSETEHGSLRIQHFPTSIVCFVIGMLAGTFEAIGKQIDENINDIIEIKNEKEVKDFADKITKSAVNSIKAVTYLNSDLQTEVTKAMPFISKLVSNK